MATDPVLAASASDPARLAVRAPISIEMEHYAVKDLTLDIYKRSFRAEFRDWTDCGIVIQAYLIDGERDTAELIDGPPKRRAAHRSPGEGRLLGLRDRGGEA